MRSLASARKSLIVISSAMALAYSSFVLESNAMASEAGSPTSVIQKETSEQHAFWFRDNEGMRTFDVKGNVLVPHLQPGDEVKIEGDLINTYNSNGNLVGSIKADLTEGVVLKKDAEGIYAGSTSSRGKRCIKNKWVGLGLNIAADALVCTPLSLGATPAAGLACGAGAATAITAASC